VTTKLAKSDFVGTGPVQYQLEGPIESPTRIQLKVDYTDAPVPRDFYVADYFYVENRDPTVLFVFGKRDGPDGTAKLRTRLEINFPAVFFVNQLLASSEKFHKTVREYVKRFQYEATTPGDRNLIADKAQTVHSNNVLMCLSGGDSVMDFYYISPRDIYFKPRHNRSIELEPLARVIIDPPMLLGFLDECSKIAAPLIGKFEETSKFGETVHEHNMESD
jgi:hypothetical protein